MEQVYYCGGWVEGAKSLRCQDLADRQTFRTGSARCIKWAQTEFIFLVFFFGGGEKERERLVECWREKISQMALFRKREREDGS